MMILAKSGRNHMKNYDTKHNKNDKREQCDTKHNALKLH